MKGLTPLTKIGYANASIPSSIPQQKTNLPQKRFVSSFGVRSPKPQLPLFGAMILELKTGRKRNGGLKRIDIRESRRYPFPTKKRTSRMRGSLTFPEFVLKNQRFPIWRNDFGAKNGAQAKRRIEAYWHTRNSTVIRHPQKNEPPMRGSSALPEFVPKNQGYPIWRNDFGAKNVVQAKRRIEAYWHTRKSPLSVIE